MYFIIFLGVKEDVLSAQYYTWSVIYLKLFLLILIRIVSVSMLISYVMFPY